MTSTEPSGGLRPTPQRQAVLDALSGVDDFRSAQEVHELLAGEGSGVGLATVYRTLDLLVESGLVRAHEFGEGFQRFEPRTAQADHEHLICEQCGKLVEFANERLERMLPVLADEQGFQHRRHRVEIYGVCRSCRQRELGPL